MADDETIYLQALLANSEALRAKSNMLKARRQALLTKSKALVARSEMLKARIAVFLTKS
jgi:hypothetical protein